tara:strand:+ start:99 stop:1148 length:1050 start_codon:yes stop_codon:yes gene_type:complete
MKVAIITDQHFGARKNSKLFHDYFHKFYDEIFFPYLENNNIDTVIDMGDTFDNRTGINFSALQWAKANYFDILRDRKINLTTIVGNHTAYYKNTNTINACELLLREYDNIRVITEYEELKFGGLNIAFVPWVNSDNQDSTYKQLKKSKCPVVMGHLELNGFLANAYHVMEHGQDKGIYKDFEKVYSGHYHHRNSQDNIHYLGNPYEIYWNDCGDVRGFHIFDTETLEHTPVNNPFNIFEKIYFNDTNYQTFNATSYKDKIVKVIVQDKGKGTKLDKFIDKLYQAGVAELKTIESFDYGTGFVSHEYQGQESEDTLSLLSQYVDEVETSIDKSKVKKILENVYKEACEVT